MINTSRIPYPNAEQEPTSFELWPKAPKLRPKGQTDSAAAYEAGLHHVTQVTSRRGAMSFPQLQLSGGIVGNRIIEPRG